MLHYPQLTSGSVCQFPVKRRTTLRTVSNELPSGDNIRMSDPGAARVRWQLQYLGLTDGERSSIEQLFEAAEGRLTTFTFLDPTDNLLMWSEDYTKPVWTVDPLLQVTGGIADPFGGSGAMQLTNTAQAPQSATQSIGAASWFQYCLSVYLRCDSPSTIQLVISAAGQELRSAIPPGPGLPRQGAFHPIRMSLAFGWNCRQAHGSTSLAHRWNRSWRRGTTRRRWSEPAYIPELDLTRTR